MELRLFLHGFFITLGLNGQLKISNAASAFTESVLGDSVLLTFSNISLVTWQAGGKELIMKEVIANMSTDYCQGNAEMCGLSSGGSVQFKAENVKTAANYPQDNEGNLKTLLYVEIPTEVNSTTSRIPGEILLTIITGGNRTLSSEVGQALGRVMSGQTLSRSQERGVDNELNRIMIPFAFVLLLVIALVCWVLHRVKNKRQLREERKRYTIFKNSKNCSNFGETLKSGSMVNTADIVPPTPTRPERRSTPKSCSPTNQAEEETNIDNNNTKSHKQRCSVAKKQPIRNYPPSAESEDVFDTDNDEQEKPGKKGHRRKERKRNEEQGPENKAELVFAHSQGHDKEVNEGYYRDSECDRASDFLRNSAADSAVESGSSIASSANQNRARSLPPLRKTSVSSTQEAV